MDTNRRFAELAGICWHEQRDPYVASCEKCGKIEENPDFSNPIEVLKVMRKREDWFAFCASFNTYDFSTMYDCFLLTPGALRDKAIQWMEERHERL